MNFRLSTPPAVIRGSANSRSLLYLFVLSAAGILGLSFWTFGAFLDGVCAEDDTASLCDCEVASPNISPSASSKRSSANASVFFLARANLMTVKNLFNENGRIPY